MKHFTIFVLLICLFNPVVGDKRSKPKTVEELSDPSSIFYVPHPYPKNQKQILKNLESRARRDYQLAITKSKKNRKYPPRRSILLDFFDGKSALRVGKIIKVKNRDSHFAHDYAFLIPFLNVKKELIECVAYMRADGFSWRAQEAGRLGMGGIQNLLLSRNEILERLSRQTGLNIKPEHLKQMERLKVNKYLGQMCVPIWEIILKSGKFYYYSLTKEIFYTIDERIPWEKDKNGKLKYAGLLAPYTRSIADSVNDEIIVLSVLKKNKREH